MLVEWRAAGASSHTAAPAQETRTFGAFWLDTCYSDAQVAVVYAADGRIAVELPCHRLVLAHASSFFAALFERWRHRGSDGDGSGGGPPPPPRVVIPVADSTDAAAAVALLRCCYTGDFDARPHEHAWQQLAVRALRLADLYACDAAAAACLRALEGRLFAHQLSLAAAADALASLPEPLAGGAAAESLRRMCGVRIVQEFRDLEAVLADPQRTEALGRLPSSALAALLASPDLAMWNEGAALMALALWLGAPGGAAASPEQRADAARAVRLPLVAGPLLCAAARCLPEPDPAASWWPLDELAEYYRSNRDARYELTAGRLRAGLEVPWSAPRRLGVPAAPPAQVGGAVWLSALRALYQRSGDDGAASLPLGAAQFGGFAWSAALLCRRCNADGDDTGIDPTSQQQWQLVLRLAASPLMARLGERSFAGGAASSGGVPSAPAQLLAAIGEAKAAEAARLMSCGHIQHAAGQGFAVAVSARVLVGERGAGRASAWAPREPQNLLLSEPCGGKAGAESWCLASPASPCGLCRRGCVVVSLPPAQQQQHQQPVDTLEGWRPEFWSALAPAGCVEFTAALRLLTD